MDLQPLLDQARAGDPEAWNKLLAKLRPWVRALVRRGVRDDAAASDLTQEVQLRMARGFPRFRGETLPQLQAWTRTIAANVLRDLYRTAEPPVGPLPETVAAPDPVLPTVDAEDMARLMAALEDLPGHYREIMEGRLFDGLSCVEIAQRIGQLPGTVRIWSLRAVQQLNQRLRGRP